MDEQQNLDSLIQAGNAMIEKESDVTIEDSMFCEVNGTFIWLEPKGYLKDKLKYIKYSGENRIIVGITIPKEYINMNFINGIDSDNSFEEEFYNNSQTESNINYDNSLIEGELKKMKCGKIFKALKNKGAKIKIHHQNEDSGPFSETECTELSNEDLNLLIRQIKIKKQIQLGH